MWKKVAAVLGGLLLVGAGVVFYYWRQATALPQWYEEELARQQQRAADTDVGMQWEAATTGGPAPPAVVPPPAEGEAPTQESSPAKRPSHQRARRRKPKKHVMRGFHRRTKGGSKRAVRASRATYDGSKLEAGVVLDLGNVPRDSLSERDRRLYERAVNGFPGLTKRDVYVGIEDRPTTVDGQLQLGPNPKVRVGRLRYALPEAAAKLGMSPAQLRKEFNRELRRMGFTDPDAR